MSDDQDTTLQPDPVTLPPNPDKARRAKNTAKCKAWRDRNRERVNAYHRRRYGANKEKRATYQREWRAANKDKLAALAKEREAQPERKEKRNERKKIWRATPEGRSKEREASKKRRSRPEVKSRLSAAERLHHYGVTAAEFQSMRDGQDDRCPICKIPFNPKVRNLWPCLDHDHSSGAVRGVLCRLCNTGIGQLRDSPKLLRAAARYLELHRP